DFHVTGVQTCALMAFDSGTVEVTVEKELRVNFGNYEGGSIKISVRVSDAAYGEPVEPEVLAERANQAADVFLTARAEERRQVAPKDSVIHYIYVSSDESNQA